MFATVLGIVGGLVMTVLGDMVSEEVRDRLDHLPQAILRLAARRVDPAKRKASYDDEWLPELTYILKGDEARPVTRLFVGTRYALGLLFSARRITHHLTRPAPGQLASAPDEGRDVSSALTDAQAVNPTAGASMSKSTAARRYKFRELLERAGDVNTGVEFMLNAPLRYKTVLLLVPVGILSAFGPLFWFVMNHTAWLFPGFVLVSGAALSVRVLGPDLVRLLKRS
jgi:hypothetical protein